MKKVKCEAGVKNLIIKLNNQEYSLISQQAKRQRISNGKYVKNWFERFIRKQHNEHVMSTNVEEINDDIIENKDSLKFLVYIFIFVKFIAKRYLSNESYRECFKLAESYFKDIHNSRQV